MTNTMDLYVWREQLENVKAALMLAQEKVYTLGHPTLPGHTERKSDEQQRHLADDVYMLLKDVRGTLSDLIRALNEASQS